MTVNSIVRTVGSITFVLYKSHCCVCAFDHISMLKCTLEVLNIIVIIFLLHFFNVLYMAFVNCAERILGPVPQSEGCGVSPGSSGEF